VPVRRRRAGHVPLRVGSTKYAGVSVRHFRLSFEIYGILREFGHFIRNLGTSVTV
jgi:hypothetical protein